MTQAAETRPFSVHARHVGSHHARVLEETSFEAAAVAYVEDFHAAQATSTRSASSSARSRPATSTASGSTSKSGETAPCG